MHLFAHKELRLFILNSTGNHIKIMLNDFIFRNSLKCDEAGRKSWAAWSQIVMHISHLLLGKCNYLERLAIALNTNKIFMKN